MSDTTLTFESNEQRRIAIGVLSWVVWALEPDVLQDSMESDELKTFRKNFRGKVQSAIHQIGIADDLANHPLNETPQD